MKRLLPLFLALLLVLPLTAAAAADFPLCRCSAGTEGAFYKGSGSENNPFRIRTEEQLRHMEQHPEKHYRLEKSLKLTDWTPLCQDSTFTGSLDGNGKALTLSAPLFAQIGEDGYVHDLTLKGEIQAAGPYTGFVAQVNAGRIAEVSVKGDITASGGAVGGIAGMNTGFIEGCTFSGSLQTSDQVTAGAIVGVNEPDCSDRLPGMVTAHSGFAAKRGASDKREDNTIDNIIKSVCLKPDAIEVDVRIYTDPQGNKIPVLAHDADMVGPDCVTVEEVLKLLMGDHPRAGELTENYRTVLIQLDQKETAVAEHVFPLIDELGFPLERVIFPVGTPGTMAEKLTFWKDLSDRGLQIWVTTDPSYYDHIDAYVNRLKGLQIPVVVNMSYKDATPEKTAYLKEHGYGISIWTLNSHDVIVEHMDLGAFNVTSRLEEVLAVREGFRAGLMDNEWTSQLPEAGTSSAPLLPKTEAPDEPNTKAVFIALPLCLIPAFIRKKKKNENNENK